MEDGKTALEELVTTGVAAWSGAFRLEPDVFARYLGSRLPAPAAQAADLYLACGCLQGSPGAAAAFESRVMGEVDAALRRMRLPGDLLDDVRQAVRQKLLVAEAGREPKIAAYRGRGSLVGWTRVVATRTALNVLRRRRPEVPDEDPLVTAAAPPSADPEMAYLRARHAGDVRRAVERAMETLSDDERLLLEQHFLDGLSTPQLARLHRTHRVTVLRRLDRALRRLRSEVGGFLERELGCARSTADSIVNLVVGGESLGLSPRLPPDTDRA